MYVWLKTCVAQEEYDSVGFTQEFQMQHSQWYAQTLQQLVEYRSEPFQSICQVSPYVIIIIV